ncbi:enhancer of mRNA-decapping protein 4 isoform X2 [Xenopus tropicalis]|uniref:Enhancer of mRNA-decapping protein 4 n=1 Tax=Xenopus tropicalis TaxID=8364 RepID=A0A8J0R2R6_XENTR|nr:enhancer of mRNA-decapping protein 4 isoform X2 [Xenopus tropicalis]|eukprot:XP_004913558.1 PREDICTED: enhancer of mRNA-decapping protein 4 isoform X2 [Xenopus tropicalis]
MASVTSIDVDATQHLRDILKLDRPEDSVNGNQRKSNSSFSSDLNGLLVTDQVAAVGTSLSDTNLCSAAVLSSERQIICLSGDDSSSCIEITAKDVEIVASHDSNICSKARGSNKVKIQPVAKYDWEQKYYCGNLIAVSNDYIAYATRGANGSAMVRVLSLTTAERILLKGITGSVTDLAFAHLKSNHLACLDEAGSLFVWQLSMTNGKIQDDIVVHIRRPENTVLSNFRRIIWCPYIPEESEENVVDDTSQTVALLHEDKAEVWDLEIVRANHSTWPVDVSEIKEGFIIVKGHSGRLSEGALSPDGTVLATASHDGYVKFWQIYIEGQDQPRCLHEWKPHNGRPLSCLLFCDNHKKQDPEVPFWRFLITGADQNRELKVWCTVSWTSLQTIQFSPDPFSSGILPGLKASLDLSAEFLILTDVQRKVLYVMELKQNQDEGKATFTSISEFLLTHPVLSFGIQDVNHCRLRNTEVLPSEEDNNSISQEPLECESVESAAGVLIKLFCVHTKALQDVQIWFQPRQNTEPAILGTSQPTQEDFALPDHIQGINKERMSSTQGSLHGSQSELCRITTDFLLLSTDSAPKLMTPDAFMSPSVSLQQGISSPGSIISTLTAVTPISNTSSSDTVLSRPSEEMTLSTMLQLDTSRDGTLQSSSRNSAVVIPGMSETSVSKPAAQLVSSNHPLELQDLDPLVVPQASPTRERSPDVISSASTAIPQDIPEIASETLQRSYISSVPLGLSVEGCDSSHHSDSMSSAASALHLLSPHNLSLDHGHRPIIIGSSVVENERINAPSLLESKIQEDNVDIGLPQPWPAAPDITKETRNSLDSSRNGQDRGDNSFHRHNYHLLQQHDSQDASAEQSDHDDEVASLASISGSFGGKGQHLPIKDWKSKLSPRSSPKLRRKSKKDEMELTQSPRISDHMANYELQEELLCMLRNQQKELCDLRQNQLELMKKLTDHMDAVQSSIMGHVERVIDTQQEQEQRRVERILSDGHERNGQLQEYLSQQLSHSLSGSLCNRVDKIIREEMKKTISQCITKTLDPVTAQLTSTVAAKVTAVEGVLKENVTKMVKSKNVTDAIGRVAAESLQAVIQSSYREAFQSIVLPAFERSCQSMFQQINGSFKQGTQEYMQQLEAHLRSRKMNEQETRDPLVTQLQQMVDSLQSITDQLASNIASNVRTEVQHQIHIAVGNMQDSILSQVQRIIKEEVSHAMKEQQAAVTSSIMQAMRSAAGTPIPSSHMDFHSQQTHILQLMQQGQINKAFQQALTASDLNLILYVCETVDPQQVFGQHPCPLSQPVLLSLIQQLSFDLGSRTEIKLNYLEEAVMHLDHSDPVTRDHMGTVLNQVRQKLFQFLQAEPQNALQKPARRLLIMLQGLALPTLS